MHLRGGWVTLWIIVNKLSHVCWRVLWCVYELSHVGGDDIPRAKAEAGDSVPLWIDDCDVSDMPPIRQPDTDSLSCF